MSRGINPILILFWVLARHIVAGKAINFLMTILQPISLTPCPQLAVVFRPCCVDLVKMVCTSAGRAFQVAVFITFTNTNWKLNGAKVQCLT